MAERRMFAKTIALSDAFLDMPMSARCLYFTLGMVADDDGFVNRPKAVMRECGASEDDIKLLIAKKFILTFDSGIIVIKHWRINNYLRNDRYKETSYTEEKSMLITEANGAYRTAGIPKIESGIPVGIPSIEKDSIDKGSKRVYGEYHHVRLTQKEYDKLQDEFGNVEELIKFLDESIELKGYKYKSHYLAIRKWVVDAVKEKKGKQPAIDSTYDIDSIEQKAMMNDDYDI